MASLIAVLSPQVDPDIRSDGASCHHARQVTSLSGDAWDVQATVLDGEVYNVEIHRDEDRLLHITCDCQEHRDFGDACKHIWATLVGASAKGYLRGDGSYRGLTFDYGEPSDDDPYQFEDYDDDDDDLVVTPTGRGRGESWPPLDSRTQTRPKPRKKAAAAPWDRDLKALEQQFAQNSHTEVNDQRWAARRLIYVMDLWKGVVAGKIPVSLCFQERKKNGDWSKPRSEGIQREIVLTLPDEEDRAILTALLGADQSSPYGYSYSGYGGSSWFHMGRELARTLLPRLCKTGRFFWRGEEHGELLSLAWDDGPPWEFLLQARPGADGAMFQVEGVFARGEERAPIDRPKFANAGLVFWQDRVSPLLPTCDERWIHIFGRTPIHTFPISQRGEWLRRYFHLARPPRIEWPDGFQLSEVAGQPRACLIVKPEKDRWRGDRVVGEPAFEYAGTKIAADKVGDVFQPDTNTLIRRDAGAEHQFLDRLRQLGWRLEPYYNQAPRWHLQLKAVPKVIATLLAEGWHVEAHGKLYRRPGKIDIDVKTGVDWFELSASVQFDNQTIALPKLLSALRKGETTIVLGDGSLGMLPEDWLKKYGLLVGLGKEEKDKLKFGRSQAGLLDALLAAQPEARVDAGFTKIRDELKRFDGIQAADPGAGFVGELRGYQREGLGWLHFLDRFGLGGCLADDMGLGKTVQVLALLAERKSATPPPGPALVVAPRSLIFNWMQEATRFAPSLRVLDHTGIDRLKPGEHFKDYDLILTTYGTLRRDALEFKDQTFDYAILDEAQAIKNSNTESAKAARLLNANHRLTLTGTPVENHLGDIWSIFEFLNPGMLGQAAVFQALSGSSRSPDPTARELLGKALRPFLLRRTKDQVAKDLPQKNEQTLFADLEPAQRKLYDELRDYYRQSLLSKVEKEGMGKAKIMVLEALLRLRQAACHPGLIDAKHAEASSAKLDMLLPQLTEVWEEGHKALVFSQFTSLLALLRKRLDKDGITYEYLDGKTRHRGDKVERFQGDPDCKLFLISLKAGGVGLNLTAAEYVFLLDPWWNPAVEAQAIDRTHRIGQTKPVFAYRIIARDTVEEKVLQLQQQKRELADAILSADNSLIRTLGREDLELLLS